MSNQVTQIAMRHKVVPAAGWQDEENKWIDILEWFNLPINPDQDLDDMYINHEQHGGWTAHIVDGGVYVDYILLDESDSYEINQSIFSKTFENIGKLYALRFLIKDLSTREMRVNYPVVQSEHLKILYFHNGGCAGISEVV